MKNTRHCGSWQRNAVAIAVASCFVIATPLYANPIGANIVNGAVTISQQGNALNITNSPGAIINWQGFSIGVNEITRFIQQSAASGVLNRVVGQDPSSILGALQSNGRVFLINPNGVLFGAGAQVDVAGLVVSTLNLSNADFLAGRYNFTARTGAGGIDNQGNLTALPGGQLYLVAPSLSNSGLITSPQGDIILAAGNSVELVNANSPDMRVVISAPDNQAINLGSIVANSGRVGIYAGLINHHGIVSADTATVGATGKVVFTASKDINLEPGSVISASGAQGGAHDGGEVRIVADGKLAMRHGAQVHVDGGVDGGNGGFLELSGKTGLALHGSFSGKAYKPGYHAGKLLLDPQDIVISSTGCTLGINCSGGGASSGTSGSTYFLNANSGAGVLTMSRDLSGLAFSSINLAAANDITLSAALENAHLNSATSWLNLTAGHDIKINAPIGGASPLTHSLYLNATNGIQINDSVHIGSANLFSAQAGAGGIVKAAGKDLVAGNIFLNTSGGITLNSGIVQSLSSNGGSPDISISAGSGTAAIGATVTASKMLSITADKIISTGGVLDTTAGSSGGGQIMLNALNGIGAVGNPIRIQRDFQTVSATNGSGGSGSGDIALSLASGDLNVYSGTAGSQIVNQASNGGIDLTAETGNVYVNSYTSISDGDIPTGGKLALRAGNDLNIASGVSVGNGTGARFNHDLTLQAGNNINILGGYSGANIYLGGNTLTLTANALGAGASGDVIIRQATVDTLGDMNVSGRDFLVGEQGVSGNTNVNAGGALSIGSPSLAMRDVKILGGMAGESPPATASVTADSISINAQSLTLEGGSASSYGNNANAELIATNDIHITLSGGLTVTGGSVGRGWAADSSAAYSLIRAGRNATILADGAITLAGGDIYAGNSGDVSARIAAANDGSGNLTINGNLNPTAGGLTLTGGNINGGSSGQASALLVQSYPGDMSLNVSSLNLNGGTGADASIYAAGNQSITVAGDMALNAGLGTATVISNGASQNIATVGDLTLTGGAGAYNVAEISNGYYGGTQHITVGGDLLLTGGGGSNAYAQILGRPDVGSVAQPVVVGGVIRMDDGTGSNAYARIESGAIYSTYVHFPNRYTGGYFVNGVESVVASGNTGFFASGSAAILDTNLRITYATPPVTPPPVTPPSAEPPPPDSGVLNGIDLAQRLADAGVLITSLEQPGEEENPLEKKPTYTCQ